MSLKSLQNHFVQRSKSDSDDMNSNLSVEIYQSRHSVQARGETPPSRRPETEEVIIKHYCWRGLSQ